MKGWNVTYEVITPESAGHGDADERGFEAENVTLAEALSAIGYGRPSLRRPAGLEDSGNWFSAIDPDRDYGTGAETYYALHPPDTITGASYARVARLLVR